MNLHETFDWQRSQQIAENYFAYSKYSTCYNGLRLCVCAISLFYYYYRCWDCILLPFQFENLIDEVIFLYWHVIWVFFCFSLILEEKIKYSTKGFSLGGYLKIIVVSSMIHENIAGNKKSQTKESSLKLYLFRTLRNVWGFKQARLSCSVCNFLVKWFGCFIIFHFLRVYYLCCDRVC